MSLIVDQDSNFKHFCKICEKGFMCGRALGGHMRTHGTGDEIESLDNDWEEKDVGSNGGTSPPNNKRMYGLRVKPNRPGTSKGSENCGMESLSCKSFLDHGKCICHDDVKNVLSSPNTEGEGKAVDKSSWLKHKRKRSLRNKVENYTTTNMSPSNEEQDLAADCLMMLSNAVESNTMAEQIEDSFASSSRQEENKRNCFLEPFISHQVKDGFAVNEFYDNDIMNLTPDSHTKGLFECKACKKVFNSHQALGGHRASHKKVKGCFAVRLDNNSSTVNDEVQELMRSIKASHGESNNPMQEQAISKGSKSNVHQCSVCDRKFSSGQALGGHKRCHWLTPSIYNQIHQFNPLFAVYNHPSILEDHQIQLHTKIPTLNDHKVSTRETFNSSLCAERRIKTLKQARDPTRRHKKPHGEKARQHRGVLCIWKSIHHDRYITSIYVWMEALETNNHLTHQFYENKKTAFKPNSEFPITPCDGITVRPIISFAHIPILIS
ncbi:zinc finger protein ZAT9-like [Amaranthus tricolor]|uniref:zinc finger protein ZAT9-like n=1 Tax=Amaranthus tricolor TaxID=29722 RepID=UPI0025864B9F|nr:zinc finger protein ZAT9-like [Amaranthus tricolor]